MQPSRVTRRFAYAIVFIFFVALGIGAYFWGRNQNNTLKQIVTVSSAPTIAPTPDGVFQYQIPKIAKKSDYQIMLLGDSMTHAMGPHGGIFNEEINNIYRPHDIAILIDNYAQPSTSLLTINEAMNRDQEYWDVSFPPMMSRDFDMVIIESFGYNPLSQFPREEGLRRQTEILDEIVETLTHERPNAVIVFAATIAPSLETFKKSIAEISQEDRIKQVEERRAFIENHIDYALRHNIPLINLYEKSKLSDGDGNVEYINPDDDIHPSAVGLIFIGQEIADFLNKSQILPK